MSSTRVLFVCLGNICRSPSAEWIFRERVRQAGLEERIAVDSCGTAPFNVGKPPDARAVAATQRAGYPVGERLARQISDEDFASSDYIVVMDQVNLTTVKGWAPADFPGEIELFLRYAPQGGNTQIPDPYYEDAERFDGVIRLLERASDGLLGHIRGRLG